MDEFVLLTNEDPLVHGPCNIDSVQLASISADLVRI